MTLSISPDEYPRFASASRIVSMRLGWFSSLKKNGQLFREKGFIDMLGIQRFDKVI